VGYYDTVWCGDKSACATRRHTALQQVCIHFQYQGRLTQCHIPWRHRFTTQSLPWKPWKLICYNIKVVYRTLAEQGCHFVAGSGIRNHLQQWFIALSSGQPLKIWCQLSALQNFWTNNFMWLREIRSCFSCAIWWFWTADSELYLTL
jgi:hypothetical protein